MSVRTISELIPDQLPGFVRDEAPLFETFLKAYYEFSEQENEALGAMRHLEDNFDIDEASLEFVEYFRREVINEIPESALADPRLLVKNIRQLYKAKGSQNAYKFLFRLLYDADVEFFYPGEKILRASDGRWTTQTTVRLQLTQGSATNLGGETIIASGGARAVVEDFITTSVGGVSVITARLSSVSGTFSNDETFQTPDSSIQGTIFATIGPINTIDIIDGGGQHQAGDVVAISGADGLSARGIVATDADDSAIQFDIVSGGSGYRANVIYSTTQSAGNFDNPAITGGSGQGASFRVVSITDTQNLDINTDFISDMQNVLIGSDPFSAGAIGANANPTLASSNAFSQLQNALTFDTTGSIGSISEIEVLDPGFGYSSLPTVAPVDYVVQDLIGDDFPDDTGVGGFKGSNAVIVANNMPGAITSVTITSGGTGYNRNKIATISNLTTANTFNASGTPNPTAVSNTIGFYSDTSKGILSSDSKLQDNFYYQQFSYVLRTPVNLSVYRAVIDKLLHPGGTKLFAEYQIVSEINLGTAVAINPDVEINLESELDVTPLATNIEVIAAEIIIRSPIESGPADLGAIPTVEDAYITFALSDVGNIDNVEAFGTPEVVLTIELDGIASTANVSEDDQIVLGLIIRKEVGQEIASTAAFGTAELKLSIEEVGAIASTAVVTSGTVTGFPTEPELITFVEDVTIPTTTLLGGSNPIAPLEDVELNASPFSSDGDIGTPITSDLAGSDINTVLTDALKPITVSHVTP